MEAKLIASAGTREQLERMINQWFFSNSYRIIETADGSLKVYHSLKGKTLENFRITVKRNRWRFEILE